MSLNKDSHGNMNDVRWIIICQNVAHSLRLRTAQTFRLEGVEKFTGRKINARIKGKKEKAEYTLVSRYEVFYQVVRFWTKDEQPENS